MILCGLKFKFYPTSLFVRSDMCFILLFHHDRFQLFKDSCSAGENTNIFCRSEPLLKTRESLVKEKTSGREVKIPAAIG